MNRESQELMEFKLGQLTRARTKKLKAHNVNVAKAWFFSWRRL